jgi:hypothetical protein
MRPLGRSKHRSVANVKMNLGAIGWGGVDWIGLSQEFSNEPSGSINAGKL